MGVYGVWVCGSVGTLCTVAADRGLDSGAHAGHGTSEQRHQGTVPERPREAKQAGTHSARCRTAHTQGTGQASLSLCGVLCVKDVRVGAWFTVRAPMTGVAPLAIEMWTNLITASMDVPGLQASVSRGTYTHSYN